MKSTICLQAKKAAEQIAEVEKELEEAVKRETRMRELRKKQREYEEMRIADKYKNRLDIKPDPEQFTQSRRPVDGADRWPNDKWEELHGPNRSRWREGRDYYRRDDRHGYGRREYVVALRNALYSLEFSCRSSRTPPRRRRSRTPPAKTLVSGRALRKGRDPLREKEREKKKKRKEKEKKRKESSRENSPLAVPLAYR